MSLRSVLRGGFFLMLGLAGTASADLQAAEALTPKALSERLATAPKGEDAERLAKEIRAWFGKDNLLKGASPKVDGLEVAWAIEVPGEGVAPRVVALEGSFNLPLVRIGTTDVYAATIPLPDGAAMRWAYEVSGKRVERVLKPNQRGADQLEVYATHPDSVPRSDVPKGKLTQQPPWKSKIYDGTSRDWWVYVPAQYKDDTPACVMVFQDGGGYKDFVPTVFDNLIASGEMPVTVAILINPGNGPGEQGRGQRSVEYDTLSDRYARYLLEEILPEVEKTVKLRHDPDSRAISGASSGGICAWTVAWERPDEFRKVLS
ncbi:enterochelin esterase [Singulisphaera sp. GP187]|uniref:alpha/beta hydrolase n=1 Tax=Singulisphaera sp. GP187 TaxID=1882752 RepID=UPI00092CDD97|nr:alpha/beta hydrolase-fold protein [Singulisphaera sp. GP187]SIO36983.1 enterochelin esterase [Singulisphaera sp. GP187]